MCGRYGLKQQPEEWKPVFLPLLSSDALPELLPDRVTRPRYNIAPTQPVAIVRNDEGKTHVAAARWGLVPFWADDLAIGNRMINARSETVHEKTSFKHAFRKRRCLIPADGYYEWRKEGRHKQPYWIHPASAAVGVLAMAGLWEVNRKASQSPVVTCTVLTTAANDRTGEIHDRMPVFLAPEHHAAWLDPELSDADGLRELLRPADEELLAIDAVSRYVSNASNEGPQCQAPPEQPGLLD